MSQLPVFFALQLLGSWACLAFGPKRELGLCVALGFLVGLALMVFLCFPLLLLAVFAPVAVVVVWLLALAASIGCAVRRGRVLPGVTIRLVSYAIGFTVLCLPFCAWNVSTSTYDSERFVYYAQVLQTSQHLSSQTAADLYAWGSFQVVAHALATVTAEDHLYALPTAFSLSLLATFYIVLQRGLAELGVSARTRLISAALVVLMLLAIPLVRQHVIYLHANWATAGYLFVFAALFWLADITNDASYLGGSFLALLAFSYNRVESPVFAAVFLPLVLSQTRLARSAILVPLLVFTTLAVAWLALLATVVPDDGVFLTTPRCLLMIGALIGVFCAFLVRDTRPVQRLLPLVPPVLAILCACGIAVAIATHLEVWKLSFGTWQHDLWLGPYWGYFLWPVVVLLGVLSVAVTAPPSSRALRYMIVLFFGVVTILSSLSHEYHWGRWGGLTRLTLHIVPLIWFYFALVYIPAFERWRARARA